MKQQPEELVCALGRKQVKNVLVKARDLLNRPYGWTKGTETRLVNRAPDGEAYCAVGAVRKITGYEADGSEIYVAVTSVLSKVVGNAGIIQFNDDRHTKKSEVLAAFDTAIAEVS